MIDNLKENGLLLTTAEKWHQGSWLISRLLTPRLISKKAVSILPKGQLTGVVSLFQKVSAEYSEEWINKKFAEICSMIEKYNPAANLALIRKGFEFAYEIHYGQKRKNEEPYIFHPLSIVFILLLNLKLSEILEDKEAAVNRSSLDGIASIRGTILDPMSKNGIWINASKKRIRLKPNQVITEENIRNIAKDDFDKVWPTINLARQRLARCHRLFEIIIIWALMHDTKEEFRSEDKYGNRENWIETVKREFAALADEDTARLIIEGIEILSKEKIGGEEEPDEPYLSRLISGSDKYPLERKLLMYLQLVKVADKIHNNLLTPRHKSTIKTLREDLNLSVEFVNLSRVPKHVKDLFQEMYDSLFTMELVKRAREQAVSREEKTGSQFNRFYGHAYKFTPQAFLHVERLAKMGDFIPWYANVLGELKNKELESKDFTTLRKLRLAIKELKSTRDQLKESMNKYPMCCYEAARQASASLARHDIRHRIVCAYNPKSGEKLDLQNFVIVNIAGFDFALDLVNEAYTKEDTGIALVPLDYLRQMGKESFIADGFEAYLGVYLRPLIVDVKIGNGGKITRATVRTIEEKPQDMVVAENIAGIEWAMPDVSYEYLCTHIIAKKRGEEISGEDMLIETPRGPGKAAVHFGEIIETDKLFVLGDHRTFYIEPGKEMLRFNADSENKTHLRLDRPGEISQGKNRSPNLPAGNDEPPFGQEGVGLFNNLTREENERIRQAVLSGEVETKELSFAGVQVSAGVDAVRFLVAEENISRAPPVYVARYIEDEVLYVVFSPSAYRIFNYTFQPQNYPETPAVALSAIAIHELAELQGKSHNEAVAEQRKAKGYDGVVRSKLEGLQNSGIIKLSADKLMYEILIGELDSVNVWEDMERYLADPDFIRLSDKAELREKALSKISSVRSGYKYYFRQLAEAVSSGKISFRQAQELIESDTSLKTALRNLPGLRRLLDLSINKAKLRPIADRFKLQEESFAQALRIRELIEQLPDENGSLVEISAVLSKLREDDSFLAEREIIKEAVAAKKQAILKELMPEYMAQAEALAYEKGSVKTLRDLAEVVLSLYGRGEIYYAFKSVVDYKIDAIHELSRREAIRESREFARNRERELHNRVLEPVGRTGSIVVNFGLHQARYTGIGEGVRFAVQGAGLLLEKDGKRLVIVYSPLIFDDFISVDFLKGETPDGDYLYEYNRIGISPKIEFSELRGRKVTTSVIDLEKCAEQLPGLKRFIRQDKSAGKAMISALAIAAIALIPILILSWHFTAPAGENLAWALLGVPLLRGKDFIKNRNILAVCENNTFRSRLLQYFLKEKLAGRGIEVISGGTNSTLDGSQLHVIRRHLKAIHHPFAMYYDPTYVSMNRQEYRRRHIEKDDGRKADIILAAIENNRRRMVTDEKFKFAPNKIRLITDYLPKNHSLRGKDLPDLGFEFKGDEGTVQTMDAQELLKLYEKLNINRIIYGDRLGRIINIAEKAKKAFKKLIDLRILKLINITLGTVVIAAILQYFGLLALWRDLRLEHLAAFSIITGAVFTPYFDFILEYLSKDFKRYPLSRMIGQVLAGALIAVVYDAMQSGWIDKKYTAKGSLSRILAVGLASGVTWAMYSLYKKLEAKQFQTKGIVDRRTITDAILLDIPVAVFKNIVASHLASHDIFIFMTLMSLYPVVVMAWMYNRGKPVLNGYDRLRIAKLEKPLGAGARFIQGRLNVIAGKMLGRLGINLTGFRDEPQLIPSLRFMEQWNELSETEKENIARKALSVSRFWARQPSGQKAFRPLKHLPVENNGHFTFEFSSVFTLGSEKLNAIFLLGIESHSDEGFFYQDNNVEKRVAYYLQFNQDSIDSPELSALVSREGIEDIGIYLSRARAGDPVEIYQEEFKGCLSSGLAVQQLRAANRAAKKAAEKYIYLLRKALPKEERIYNYTRDEALYILGNNWNKKKLYRGMVIAEIRKTVRLVYQQEMRTRKLLEEASRGNNLYGKTAGNTPETRASNGSMAASRRYTPRPFASTLRKLLSLASIIRVILRSGLLILMSLVFGCFSFNSADRKYPVLSGGNESNEVTLDSVLATGNMPADSLWWSDDNDFEAMISQADSLLAAGKLKGAKSILEGAGSILLSWDKRFLSEGYFDDCLARLIERWVKWGQIYNREHPNRGQGNRRHRGQEWPSSQNTSGYFGNLTEEITAKIKAAVADNNNWEIIPGLKSKFSFGGEKVNTEWRAMKVAVDRAPPGWIWAKEEKSAGQNKLVIYFSSQELLNVIKGRFFNKINLALETIAFHEYLEVIKGKQHELADKEISDNERYKLIAFNLENMFSNMTKAAAVLKHLAKDPGEFDSNREDSIGYLLLQILKLDDLSRNRIIARLLRHMLTKEQFIQFIKDIREYWNIYANNFSSLVASLDKWQEDTYYEPKTQPFLFKQTDAERLVLAIIRSRTASHTVTLNTALDFTREGRMGPFTLILMAEYENLYRLLMAQNIDLRVRMKTLNNLSELINVKRLIEFLLISSRSDPYFREPRVFEFEENRERKMILFGLQSKLEQVLGTYMELCKAIASLQSNEKAKARRLQEKISQEVKSLRAELIEVFLGRKIKSTEKRLLNNNVIKETLPKIIKLVSTIELGNGFDEGHIARNILREALRQMFETYASSKRDKARYAINAVNKWILSIDKEIRPELLKKENHNQEGLWDDVDLRNAPAGNKETKEQLIASRYKEKLFRKGVETQVLAELALTEGHKREQVLSAGKEMVEIALHLGMKTVFGAPLTIDYADNIDSSAKAEAFEAEMIKALKGKGEWLQRVRAIVATIKDFEKQKANGETAQAEYKVTIQKDFFKEALAGDNVPGCFNPNGLYRQMPFVHAAEINSCFMQVFSPSGNQVANAVIIFTTKGAYVYPGYNSTSHYMDHVFGEALKALSRLVPRIFLNPISAGFNSLSQYATRSGEISIVKPAVLFTKQHYDYGKVDEQGNLTLTGDFYVVTKESIAAGNGFAPADPARSALPLSAEEQAYLRLKVETCHDEIKSAPRETRYDALKRQAIRILRENKDAERADILENAIIIRAPDKLIELLRKFEQEYEQKHQEALAMTISGSLIARREATKQSVFGQQIFAVNAFIDGEYYIIINPSRLSRPEEDTALITILHETFAIANAGHDEAEALAKRYLAKDPQNIGLGEAGRGSGRTQVATVAVTNGEERPSPRIKTGELPSEEGSSLAAPRLEGPVKNAGKRGFLPDASVRLLKVDLPFDFERRDYYSIARRILGIAPGMEAGNRLLSGFLPLAAILIPIFLALLLSGSSLDWGNNSSGISVLCCLGPFGMARILRDPDADGCSVAGTDKETEVKLPLIYGVFKAVYRSDLKHEWFTESQIRDLVRGVSSDQLSALVRSGIFESQHIGGTSYYMLRPSIARMPYVFFHMIVKIRALNLPIVPERKYFGVQKRVEKVIEMYEAPGLPVSGQEEREPKEIRLTDLGGVNQVMEGIGLRLIRVEEKNKMPVKLQLHLSSKVLSIWLADYLDAWAGSRESDFPRLSNAGVTHLRDFYADSVMVFLDEAIPGVYQPVVYFLYIAGYAENPGRGKLMLVKGRLWDALPEEIQDHIIHKRQTLGRKNRARILADEIEMRKDSAPSDKLDEGGRLAAKRPSRTLDSKKRALPLAMILPPILIGLIADSGCCPSVVHQAAGTGMDILGPIAPTLASQWAQHLFEVTSLLLSALLLALAMPRGPKNTRKTKSAAKGHLEDPTRGDLEAPSGKDLMDLENEVGELLAESEPVVVPASERPAHLSASPFSSLSEILLTCTKKDFSEASPRERNKRKARLARAVSEGRMTLSDKIIARLIRTLDGGEIKYSAVTLLLALSKSQQAQRLWEMVSDLDEIERGRAQRSYAQILEGFAIVKNPPAGKHSGAGGKGTSKSSKPRNSKKRTPPLALILPPVLIGLIAGSGCCPSVVHQAAGTGMDILGQMVALWKELAQAISAHFGSILAGAGSILAPLYGADAGMAYADVRDFGAEDAIPALAGYGILGWLGRNKENKGAVLDHQQQSQEPASAPIPVAPELKTPQESPQPDFSDEIADIKNLCGQGADKVKKGEFDEADAVWRTVAGRRKEIASRLPKVVADELRKATESLRRAIIDGRKAAEKQSRAGFIADLDRRLSEDNTLSGRWLVLIEIPADNPAPGAVIERKTLLQRNVDALTNEVIEFEDCVARGERLESEEAQKIARQIGASEVSDYLLLSDLALRVNRLRQAIDLKYSEIWTAIKEGADSRLEKTEFYMAFVYLRKNIKEHAAKGNHYLAGEISVMLKGRFDMRLSALQHEIDSGRAQGFGGFDKALKDADAMLDYHQKDPYLDEKELLRVQSLRDAAQEKVDFRKLWGEFHAATWHIDLSRDKALMLAARLWFDYPAEQAKIIQRFTETNFFKFGWQYLESPDRQERFLTGLRACQNQKAAEDFAERFIKEEDEAERPNRQRERSYQTELGLIRNAHEFLPAASLLPNLAGLYREFPEKERDLDTILDEGIRYWWPNLLAQEEKAVEEADRRAVLGAGGSECHVPVTMREQFKKGLQAKRNIPIEGELGTEAGVFIRDFAVGLDARENELAQAAKAVEEERIARKLATKIEPIRRAIGRKNYGARREAMDRLSELWNSEGTVKAEPQIRQFLCEVLAQQLGDPQEPWAIEFIERNVESALRLFSKKSRFSFKIMEEEFAGQKQLAAVLAWPDLTVFNEASGHRKFFEGIKRLILSGAPRDLVTAFEALSRRMREEQGGGSEFEADWEVSTSDLIADGILAAIRNVIIIKLYQNNEARARLFSEGKLTAQAEGLIAEMLERFKERQMPRLGDLADEFDKVLRGETEPPASRAPAAPAAPQAVSHGPEGRVLKKKPGGSPQNFSELCSALDWARRELRMGNRQILFNIQRVLFNFINEPAYPGPPRSSIAPLTRIYNAASDLALTNNEVVNLIDTVLVLLEQAPVAGEAPKVASNQLLAQEVRGAETAEFSAPDAFSPDREDKGSSSWHSGRAPLECIALLGVLGILGLVILTATGILGAAALLSSLCDAVAAYPWDILAGAGSILAPPVEEFLNRLSSLLFPAAGLSGLAFVGAIPVGHDEKDDIVERLQAQPAEWDEIDRENAIRYFGISRKLWDTLTRDDRILLPYLLRIARLCGRVYLKQNQSPGGVTDFPIEPDMLRVDQVADFQREHSVVNTSVTNPNAVDGDVPFFVAYREELYAIALLFDQAAKEVRDPDMKTLLYAQGGACLNDSWRLRDEFWMKVLARARSKGIKPFGGSRLLYYFGPIEPKLPASRGAFEMKIGIINEEDVLGEQAKRTFEVLTSNSTIDHLYSIEGIVHAGRGFSSVNFAKNLPNYPQVKRNHGTISIIDLRAFRFALLGRGIKDRALAITGWADYGENGGRLLRFVSHEAGHATQTFDPQTTERISGDLGAFYNDLYETDVTLKRFLHLAEIREIWTEDQRREAIYADILIAANTILNSYILDFDRYEVAYFRPLTMMVNYLKERGFIRIKDGVISPRIGTARELSACEDALVVFAQEVHRIYEDADFLGYCDLIAQYGKYQVFGPVLAKRLKEENLMEKHLYKIHDLISYLLGCSAHYLGLGVVTKAREKYSLANMLRKTLPEKGGRNLRQAMGDMHRRILKLERAERIYLQELSNVRIRHRKDVMSAFWRKKAEAPHWLKVIQRSAVNGVIMALAGLFFATVSSAENNAASALAPPISDFLNHLSSLLFPATGLLSCAVLFPGFPKERGLLRKPRINQVNCTKSTARLFNKFRGRVYYPASAMDISGLITICRIFPKITEIVLCDDFRLDGKGFREHLFENQFRNAIHEIREGLMIFKDYEGVEEISLVESSRRNLSLRIKIKFGSLFYWDELRKREIYIQFIVKDLFNFEESFDVVYVRFPGFGGKLSRSRDFWMKMARNLKGGGIVVINDPVTSHPPKDLFVMVSSIRSTKSFANVYLFKSLGNANAGVAQRDKDKYMTGKTAESHGLLTAGMVVFALVALSQIFDGHLGPIVVRGQQLALSTVSSAENNASSAYTDWILMMSGMLFLAFANFSGSNRRWGRKQKNQIRGSGNPGWDTQLADTVSRIGQKTKSADVAFEEGRLEEFQLLIKEAIALCVENKEKRLVKAQASIIITGLHTKSKILMESGGLKESEDAIRLVIGLLEDIPGLIPVHLGHAMLHLSWLAPKHVYNNNDLVNSRRIIALEEAIIDNFKDEEGINKGLRFPVGDLLKHASIIFGLLNRRYSDDAALSEGKLTLLAMLDSDLRDAFKLLKEYEQIQEKDPIYVPSSKYTL
ncbi:MAG: hypothetical protein HQL27_03035, partial [Candidatus Omnitrophica bacterium]|nr:hypothetical protein [Candidatus Omnitrophota bacterium]